MAITCQCPGATALPTIPGVVCPEQFGQIQKIAFQRLKDASGTKNKFTNTAAITALASWTAKTSATDGTKIAVSPYIQAPTSEPGDARTFGGGNETLGGFEMIVGRNPTSFSAVLRNMPQSIIKEMKKLECESASENLGVFLFDDAGRIEAIADPDTEGTYYPIPIRSLFISDKGHGGFETPDSNNLTFAFAPNYSDDLKIITPADFNPLTDL